jgi:hypothetical protein
MCRQQIAPLVEVYQIPLRFQISAQTVETRPTPLASQTSCLSLSPSFDLAAQRGKQFLSACAQF